jgi:uncharacterized protein
MANIFAIADLHLPFGAPDKSMEVFGPAWANYTERLALNWKKRIQEEDLVLIPGDISWAMRLEDAKKDLDWIAALPGTKVLLKGNHDYWWKSLSKVKSILPAKMHLLQNDAFDWNGVSIAGTRLWDSPEYDFNAYIEVQNASPEESKIEEAPEKIFMRELERLELSLKQLNPSASLRIAMTHYPPIGADLRPSRASALLEKYEIAICLFGHLHNVKRGSLELGVARGIRYALVSADYRQFDPLKVY